MDFSLNDDQRAWQMKARKFAQEVLRPISLQRDRIPDPRQTWDWEVIRQGSRLGFRTLAVPKEWGGHGVDFVTQALIMTELAKGDSAISKAFSQNWKWSHLIAASCTQDQKERFLRPFLADDTYLLGKGGTEPNAGSDNRMPPDDDPKSGWKLRAERKGDEWILNGEKCFIANGSVGKLFFVDARTNPNVSIREGSTLFMVPADTPGFRIGKVFNKSGWRFYVMRVAWEHDRKMHTANSRLAANFSTDVIQEVTQLNLEVHVGSVPMDAHAEKLARDAFIWVHLAGDCVQRMRVARRLGKEAPVLAA